MPPATISPKRSNPPCSIASLLVFLVGLGVSRRLALVRVRGRAGEGGPQPLRVRAPVHLLDRGLQAEVQALRPVAAAFRAHRAQEAVELLAARGERHDLDRDVVAAVAIDDEA